MYWNPEMDAVAEAITLINRNMRCIETETKQVRRQETDRLIETWDVLKLQNAHNDTDRIID